MSEPIHIISLGAGVQSSTMALMAACGEITPMPAGAIFADTGDEPKSVYDWLEWLAPRLPFPIHWASTGTSLSAHAPGPREVGRIPVLVDGLPGGMGRCRGYGNAIVPQVAAQFIQASEEAIKLTAHE